MIEIKAGTPQPLDCPNCKGKFGYQIPQRIQKYVDLIYTKEGEDDGCVYGEHEKILSTHKRPACANCVKTLPFKVRM